MSVERVERKDESVVWRVRWRQGGRNRSNALGRKRDAEAFDAEPRAPQAYGRARAAGPRQGAAGGLRRTVVAALCRAEPCVLDAAGLRRAVGRAHPAAPG
jgi:hypothetical protein